MFDYLKEQLSPAAKRKIKKICFRDTPDQTLTKRTGKWLGRKACKNSGKLPSIETNLATAGSLPANTYRKEAYIEKLLHKGWYTFDDLLIITDPFYMAPLTALAIFETKEKYSVRVTVKGKQEKNDICYYDSEKYFHRVPIWGMYADWANEVELCLMNGEKKEIQKRTIFIHTKSLPPLIQDDFEVEQSSEEKRLILITGGLDVLPCIIDGEGDVRYYIRRNPKGYGIYPISDGKFLYLEKKVSTPTFTNPNAVQFYEMDFLGRATKSYFVEDGCHHDGGEMMPGGNFLMASSSHLGQTEDQIIEIDRVSGKIVKKLRMEQILGSYYKDRPDWAHINSVEYIKEENAVYVCLRNVHSACKINWNKMELEWILADPRVWEESPIADKVLTPVGTNIWPFQAHAFHPLGDGRFLLFDNHVNARRPMPFFEEDKNSYLSIFCVDEEEYTVRTQKNISIPKTKIRSNAVLEEDKQRIFSMAGYLQPKKKGNRGLIEEFDNETGMRKMRIWVKEGFFRAYPFYEMHSALASCVKQEAKYMVGNLEKPHRHEPRPVADGLIDEEMVKMILREDVLYIKAPDHYVEKVYFVDGQKTYVKNYDTTVQTMPELFGEYDYYLPIWLKDLKPGNYRIYIKHMEQKLDTGKYIKLKNNCERK